MGELTKKAWKFNNMVRIGIVAGGFNNDSYYGTNFKRIKELGYDAVDYGEFANHKSRLFSMSDEERISFLKGYRQEIESNGLVVNQLHALWDPDFENENRDNILPYYIKAIEGAHYLGCPYVVIHPLCPKRWWVEQYTDEEIINFNLSFFKKLIPYLEKYNVSLAVENLPFLDHPDFFSPKGTYNFVKLVNHKQVVLCIDTGHFNMFKGLNVYDELMSFKDKLKVFHMHDNNSWTDSHSFPFMGSFDWQSFAKAVKDMDFNGVLSLETDANNMPSELKEYFNEGLAKIIKLIQKMVN